MKKLLYSRDRLLRADGTPALNPAEVGTCSVLAALPAGILWSCGGMQRQQCPQHPQQGAVGMCSFSTEHLRAVLCKAILSSASAAAGLAAAFWMLEEDQLWGYSGCSLWASPPVTMFSPKSSMLHPNIPCVGSQGSPGRVGAVQFSGAFPSAGDLKNLLVPPPSLESRGSETLRAGIANPFRLSCCFLMYATSLGGLSGLGTFYKRDLLMTKLMWLSYQVWEAYSRFKENLLE